MIGRLNKDFITLTLGRIIQVVILLISIKISTALLSPDEVGNLYVIVTLTGFFTLFFINPIGQYINRKSHEWHLSGVILNKLSLFLGYVLLSTLISLSFILLLPLLGIARSINQTMLAIFVPLFVLFNTINQTVIPLFNILGKQLTFTVFTALSSILALLCSYLTITSMKMTGIFWIAGQVLGIGVMGVIASIFFIMRISNRFNYKESIQDISIKNIKEVAYFSTPLALGVFFLWLQGQSYRLLIEQYINIEFLGFFGIGMSIAMSISSSFESIIMQWLYPVLYKSMTDQKIFSKTFTETINTILPIYLFLAICVTFLSAYLVEIIVGPQYKQSSIFLIFGIWVEFFRMSSNLLSIAAHSKMNTRVLFTPYFIGGIGVLIGVYLAAHSNQYRVLIPLVLLIAGGTSSAVMLLKIKKLIRLKFRIKGFSTLILLSLFFPSALFFSTHSDNMLASLSIVFIYGLYFLSALLAFLLRKDNKEFLLITRMKTSL